ncbi:MAG: class I SAM-dependent methyltransferase [Proteobacteria bacterium]|nr:class I SAM-dependent methyltransferase [Pseudomonadota bacterium]
MENDRQDKAQAFYDDYWPKNVPDYKKTREHVFEIVPTRKYKKAFDGGCGTGVNSLALAEIAENVVAFDLSSASLKTAADLAAKLELKNIKFVQGSLLSIPQEDSSFDLVYSWGVIHHTVDPVKSFHELVRILEPGGCLVLAVYLQTRLTFIHEITRKICLKMPRLIKSSFIKSLAVFIRSIEKVKKLNVVRDDNPYIESKIEDWFFVPEKHYFTIDAMEKLYGGNGLTFELLCEKTGRFKSTSNFIVRGIKNTN